MRKQLGRHLARLPKDSNRLFRCLYPPTGGTFPTSSTGAARYCAVVVTTAGSMDHTYAVSCSTAALQPGTATSKHRADLSSGSANNNAFLRDTSPPGRRDSMSNTCFVSCTLPTTASMQISQSPRSKPWFHLFDLSKYLAAWRLRPIYTATIPNARHV